MTRTHEILEDRWRGLMTVVDEEEETMSRLAIRLHETLSNLYIGVARDDPHATRDFPAGSFPGIDREGGSDQIRRSPEYLDWVERIWVELRDYLEQ